MKKLSSKQELINYFFRARQKEFFGGGNYLHKVKRVEKQPCGKKSST